MSYIDLDDIKDGTFYKEDGRLAAPPPEKSEPPAWLLEKIREQFKKDLAHGTIVVISKLDNLTWPTTKSLALNLTQHFGVVYRNWLRKTNVFVQGNKVRAVDPMFLDKSAQFFDVNELRAEPLPETELMVKDQESREEIGKVTVRYSYLPPGFQNDDGKIAGKRNSRFKVMKEHNGILILRAGRQIDVVRCPWITLQTYDRNWKIEIDFDPRLDEEFSITTSKQQINLSERMWKQLEQAGVKRAIEGLRKRYNDAVPVAKEKQEQPADGDKRTSEEIMEAAQKFKTTRAEPSPSQEEERTKNFAKKVKERVEVSGQSEEDAQRDIESDVLSTPYKLSFENLPGGNFYRVEPVASQIHLIINRAHPFYTEVHSSPESTPRLRAALELLLFVLAETELDASDERKIFYESERSVWSQRISTTFRLLEQKDPKSDAASAAVEVLEVEAMAAEVG